MMRNTHMLQTTFMRSMRWQDRARVDSNAAAAAKPCSTPTVYLLSVEKPRQCILQPTTACWRLKYLKCSLPRPVQTVEE